MPRPPTEPPTIGTRFAADAERAFDELPDYAEHVLTQDEGSLTYGSACVPDAIA